MKRTSEVKRIRLNVIEIKKLDALYSQVPSGHCKGLCQDSCGPIVMSQTEEDRIACRVGYRPQFMFADLAKHCPMLKDGKCSVYDIRPMICRLWGSSQDKGLKCPHGCGENLLPAEATAKLLSESIVVGRGVNLPLEKL